MGNALNIGGWLAGSVDGNASVVDAKNTYLHNPTQANLAAYNAAYANAWASNTALVPGSGAYFASVAVTADIREMSIEYKINNQYPSNGQILTLIGNIVTLAGQGVQILGLSSTPVTFGGGLAAFSLGELIDAAGFALTASGVALDHATISNYVQSILSTSGFSTDSNGNYIPLAQAELAFGIAPNGDTALFGPITAGSLNSAVSFNGSSIQSSLGPSTWGGVNSNNGSLMCGPGNTSNSWGTFAQNGGSLGNQISSDLGNAQQQIVDPLVISMDGKAVTTTSVANGTFVDLQGTGFAEQSSWFSSNAGILVDVTNPNGTLNNGFTVIGSTAINQNGNALVQTGKVRIDYMASNAQQNNNGWKIAA